MKLTDALITSAVLTAVIVSVQITAESSNLRELPVVAIYTRHCVRLNCIYIVLEAARRV